MLKIIEPKKYLIDESNEASSLRLKNERTQKIFHPRKYKSRNAPSDDERAVGRTRAVAEREPQLCQFAERRLAHGDQTLSACDSRCGN